MRPRTFDVKFAYITSKLSQPTACSCLIENEYTKRHAILYVWEYYWLLSLHAMFATADMQVVFAGLVAIVESQIRIIMRRWRAGRKLEMQATCPKIPRADLIVQSVR